MASTSKFLACCDFATRRKHGLLKTVCTTNHFGQVFIDIATQRKQVHVLAL